MRMEEISISNIASTQRKAPRGPSSRSEITLMRRRTSTGRGRNTKAASEICPRTSGSETTTSTSKSSTLPARSPLHNLSHHDRLTHHHNMVLRIVLEDFKDNHVWVEYGTFKIQSEKLKYGLVVDEYRGSIADSFLYHNNQPFSTFDMNNDISNTTASCAHSMGSGWWFKR